MNILVISDKFANGGLETHVYELYNYLKDKNKFTFAFGIFNSELHFNDANIYDKFNFSPFSNINQLLSDIDRLVEIIKEEKIDLITIHPYYAIFPAMFASQICKIPITYTAHGFASFNFPNSINDMILFNYAVNNAISKIFCVSQNGVNAFKSMTNRNDIAIHIPNGIDINKYSKNEIISNKNWAICSRLDNDKLPEIEKLVTILPNLDINHLFIYGEGSNHDYLVGLVKKLNIDNKVSFMGHSDSLNKVLNNSINGIFGTGRTAIESLSMGYPTILMGYGKICGAIDNKLYSNVKDINFVARDLYNISIDELNLQIKDIYNNQASYDLSSKIKEDFSLEVIGKNYVQAFNNLKFNESLSIINIYEEMNKFSSDDKNQNFLMSKALFDNEKKLLFKNDMNLQSKLLSFFSEKYHELYDNNQKIHNLISNLEAEKVDMENIIQEMNKLKDYYANEYNSLKREIDITRDRINIKYLFRNTIKKIFKFLARKDK